MNEPEYKRLTRPRNRTQFAVALVSRCSLWIANDHLLHIDSNGYSESYRRFYFRDIQAILLMRTHSWIYRLLAFGFLGACALGAGLLIGNVAAYWVFGAITAAFFAGSIYNLAAGPSCICQFRTAVQEETIPSLNRVKKTRRILARIQPLIEQAQGSISAADAQKGINGLLGVGQGSSPAEAPQAENSSVVADSTEPGSRPAP